MEYRLLKRPQAPSLPSSSSGDRKLRTYALSLCFGVVLLAAAMGLALVKDWLDHRDQIEQRARDSVSTLARYTAIEMTALDQALAILADQISRDPAMLGSPERLGTHLRDIASAGHPAVAFGVTDAQGTIVATSSRRSPTGPPISIADRPAFRLHASSIVQGAHISEPYLSKPSGLKIFSVSRRISTPDGNFAGIVAATVQSELLFDVLSEIAQTAGNRQVIARDDGIILACVPSCVLGADISDRPAIKAVRAGQRSGLGSGIAPLDQVRVMSAFRAVDGYPLVAISATPEHLVLAQWWETARAHTALSALLLMLAMFGAYSHFRALRRQFDAEHQLRKSSEQLLRTSVESLRSGFVVFDGQNRLRLWNRRFVEMFPYLEKALVTGVDRRTLAAKAIDHRSPGLSPRLRDALIARLTTAPSAHRGTRKWRESDDLILEVTDSVTDEGLLVMVYRDVTERERQEADLRRALHAEREMNAQQRRFVAVVSHEFRTPLTIIDGAAQLIATVLPDNAPKSVHERLARIRHSVKLMVDLIERILSSARFSEGRIRRTDEDVDLVRLVQTVIERQRSISPNFTIEATSQPPDIVAKADPRLIEQVVTNLLSNAVKYSGKSTRVIVDIEADEREITIAVRDFGVGVAAGEVPHLFTRFYRAKTSRGVAGTGLGLHLSRDLIAMHGGRIDVVSELDKGSTFTVRLPRHTEIQTPKRNAA